MRLNMKDLDNLLEYVLMEDDPIPPPQTADDVAQPEPIDASLDQVVDRYIIRYERDSIPTAETYEDELLGTEEDVASMGESVQPLFEQEDEEDAPAEAPADAGLDLGTPDETPAADTGGGAGAKQEEPVVNTPQIDLNNFARSVARLVNNFEALLNPQSIILNRVKTYIESNYDERTAKELMDILDQNYSLRPVKTEQEEETEQYPEPYLAGALSSG